MFHLVLTVVLTGAVDCFCSYCILGHRLSFIFFVNAIHFDHNFICVCIQYIPTFINMISIIIKFGIIFIYYENFIIPNIIR
jgi:hypothetical protein